MGAENSLWKSQATVQHFRVVVRKSNKVKIYTYVTLLICQETCLGILTFNRPFNNQAFPDTVGTILCKVVYSTIAYLIIM